MNLKTPFPVKYSFRYIDPWTYQLQWWPIGWGEQRWNRHHREFRFWISAKVWCWGANRGYW